MIWNIFSCLSLIYLLLRKKIVNSFLHAPNKRQGEISDIQHYVKVSIWYCDCQIHTGLLATLAASGLALSAL